MSSSDSLPPPSPDARARSATLAARIREQIERSGGWLRFDRYMQMALYEPGLGYYSAASIDIGAGGDFTTAAELGPLLPRAIADCCEPIFAPGDAQEILELGAGTGALAAELLTALAAQGRCDVPYRILEPSAALRARQRERLAKFGTRVAWLEGLPAAPLAGLILANEVGDALPCVRFVKTARGALPLGVVTHGDLFRWQVGLEDRELGAAVAALESRLEAPLEEGYHGEICLVLGPWIASLADVLGRGALLLIDYGSSRRELYHAQRRDGTLACHYRHRAHADPFALPGLQDISAWVDFSACAQAARAAGLEVAGYTTQAQFLLGAASAYGAVGMDAASVAARNAVRTLLLPGAMGERFKVLLLTRGLEKLALPGRDLRSRL